MPPTEPSVAKLTLVRPPADHGRGVFIVGEGRAALGEALRPHLREWGVLDAIEPTDERLSKLTIFSASPSPSDEERQQLAHACEQAVRAGVASTVEVIADWAHDSAWEQSNLTDAFSNSSPNNIEVAAPIIASIIRRGPRAAPARDTPSPEHSTTHLISSLLMVGVSVEGRLGTGLGQPMPHVTQDELSSLKLPQRAVYELLRSLAALPGVHECLVWNTCARMELYAWAEDGADREALAHQLRKALLPSASPSTHVASLRARDAWLHLLRTAVGLNSTMPGDAEVHEQLQSAHRMAAYTGAASTRAQALIDEVADVVRAVREGTSWGHQMREYTHVALDGVLSNQPLAGKRCLVIGGSTTSCSVLRYLVERGVAPDRLTIAYRGEGRRRLVQQVRQIAGEGATRLRLGAYDAPELRTALCNADLVFLGIDRAEPILSPSGLQRDGSHPLTILDFNTHPSTHGLATQPGVTLIEAHAIAQAVEEAARASLRDPMFHQAAIDAERAIAQRVAMGP